MKSFSGLFQSKKARMLLMSGALGLAIGLVSCGGGAGALVAGVGSGGTGIAQGIVVGFGSVFVDGKEYGTANAAITEQDANGTTTSALLKLGERIRIQLDATGTTVTTAQITDQLSGPVTVSATQIVSGDWWLQVAGQWVKIVSAPQNTPSGMVTVLSGATPNSPASLTSGAELEVYGMWSWDSTKNSDVLVATRIELTSASATTSNVLVGGIVFALPSSGEARLNSASGPILQGALPASVAVGAEVTAVVSRSAWNGWAGGSVPLSAMSITSASLENGASAELSGLVNMVGNVVFLQGIAVVMPSGATVSAGDYLQISGTLLNGELQDTQVESHVNGPGIQQSIQVNAATDGLDWASLISNANAATINPVPVLLLQGTSINANSSTTFHACTESASDTEIVQVTGVIPAPGQPMLATNIVCVATEAPSLSPGTIVDYEGVVGNVDTVASTLAMSNDSSNINVIWTGSTYLDPALGLPTTWAGQNIHAIGSLQGNTLTATAILAQSTSTDN